MNKFRTQTTRLALAIILAAVVSRASAASEADKLTNMVTELLHQQSQLATMTAELQKNEKEKAGLVNRDIALKKDEQKQERTLQTLRDENTTNEAKKTAVLQGGCRPGQRSTDLALVDRCNTLIGEVNAKTTELERRARQVLNDQKQAKVSRQQLSNDTLANFANRKRLNAAVEDLNARIAALKSYLAAHCSSIPSSASLEEVKNRCGNTQFDGSAPNLPPCQTEECRRYAGSY